MSTVGEFLEIRLRPGRRADYLRRIRPLCRQVEAEAGTLIYLLHTDRDQPDTVWLYARYRDASALREHRSSAAFHQFAVGAGPLVLETNDLQVELVGNKGVPLEPRGMRGLEA